MTTPQLLRFAKMHGAGNDFVVIDAVRQRVAMTALLARLLADRHRGIGCDQVLLVEASPDGSADFGYRIFNSDGSEVEQCGNGARCFVRFVHEQGLSSARELRVRTRSGLIHPRLQPNGEVRVGMGRPRFDPEEVPFITRGLQPRAGDGPSPAWPLEVDGGVRWIRVVSMGNPHAVQHVDSVERAPVQEEGALIERHPRFPHRVNAGYMEIIHAHRIRLRVFERGAGETLSCGTGACAATVLGVRSGVLRTPVTVETRGGTLTIDWDGADNPVGLTGPATTVYTGQVDLSTLPQLEASQCA